MDDRTNLDIENESAGRLLEVVFYGCMIIVSAGLIIACWIWL